MDWNSPFTIFHMQFASYYPIVVIYRYIVPWYYIIYVITQMDWNIHRHIVYIDTMLVFKYNKCLSTSENLMIEGEIIERIHKYHCFFHSIMYSYSLSNDLKKVFWMPMFIRMGYIGILMEQYEFKYNVTHITVIQLRIIPLLADVVVRECPESSFIHRLCIIWTYRISC